MWKLPPPNWTKSNPCLNIEMYSFVEQKGRNVNGWEWGGGKRKMANICECIIFMTMAMDFMQRLCSYSPTVSEIRQHLNLMHIVCAWILWFYNLIIRLNWKIYATKWKNLGSTASMVDMSCLIIPYQMIFLGVFFCFYKKEKFHYISLNLNSCFLFFSFSLFVFLN